MNFSHFFIKIHAVLLLSLFPATAFSSEKESIIFGVLDLPPYIVVSSDDNTVRGTVPKLLESIFSPLGITVEYKLLSIPRIKKALRDGKIDAFPLMLAKGEKSTAILLSDVYLTSNDYIWSTQANYPEGIQWTSLDDLKDNTFAIINGASYGKCANYFIATNKHLFYGSDNLKLAINLLLAGRVDGLFHNEDIVKDYITRHNLGETLVKSDKVLYSNQYMIGISKKSDFASQIDKINAQIEKVNSRR